MNNHIYKFAAILFSIFILQSCGSYPESPSGVAEAFLKELAADDYSGAKSYATEESAQLLDQLGNIANLAPESEKRGQTRS